MKKIISFILVITMALGLASCTDADDNDERDNSIDIADIFSKNNKSSLFDDTEDIESEAVELFEQFADAIIREDREAIEKICYESYTEDEYLQLFELKEYLDDISGLEAKVLYSGKDGYVVSFSTSKTKNYDLTLSSGIIKDGDKRLLSNDYLQNHTCSKCEGKGKVYSSGQSCAICGGTGQQYYPNLYYDNIMGWYGGYQACSGCAGQGVMGRTSSLCGNCGGTGYR